MKLADREKMSLLLAWQEHYDSQINMIDEMENLFGSMAESRLFTAIWRTFWEYTRVLSQLLEDHAQWLEWYARENEFGQKELSAGFDGEFRKIKNFGDLLWIIELDNEKNQ